MILAVAVACWRTMSGRPCRKARPRFGGARAEIRAGETMLFGNPSGGYSLCDCKSFVKV